MPRRIGLLLVIALGVLGCSSSGSSTKRTTAEENFLHSVKKDDAGFAKGRTDDELVSLGHLQCEALDAGTTPDKVTEMLLVNDSSDAPEDVGAFLSVSVVTLCPQHTEAVASAAVN